MPHGDVIRQYGKTSRKHVSLMHERYNCVYNSGVSHFLIPSTMSVPPQPLLHQDANAPLPLLKIIGVVKRQSSGEPDAASLTTVPSKRVKSVVAFDPGRENFAVWKGFIDEDGHVHTSMWIKIDISKYDSINHILDSQPYKTMVQRSIIAPADARKCQKSKAMYALIANVLNVHTWIYTDVDVAIIETQKPGNIPARIVATAIYGYLRHVFVDRPNAVVFCGKDAKMNVKQMMADKMTMAFNAAACKNSGKIHSAYSATKTTSYEICREWLRRHGSVMENAIIDAHNARSGPMKGDDLAEAYLLGYSELINESHDVHGDPVKKPRKVKQTTTTGLGGRKGTATRRSHAAISASTAVDESELASQYEIPFKQRKINIEEYIRCSSSGSSSTPSHSASSCSSSSPSSSHKKNAARGSTNDRTSIRACASSSTGTDDDGETTEDDTYDDMKHHEDDDSDNDLTELASVVGDHLHKSSRHGLRT